MGGALSLDFFMLSTGTSAPPENDLPEARLITECMWGNHQLCNAGSSRPTTEIVLDIRKLVCPVVDLRFPISDFRFQISDLR